MNYVVLAFSLVIATVVLTASVIGLNWLGAFIIDHSWQIGRVCLNVLVGALVSLAVYTAGMFVRRFARQVVKLEAAKKEAVKKETAKQV